MTIIVYHHHHHNRATQGRPSPSSSSSTSSSPSSTPSGAAALPAGAPAGLMNLGNTCYMNASLQALYSLESFRNLMLSGGAGRYGADKELTQELSELFKLMKESADQRQQQQPISPAKFKFAFSRHQSKFSGFGQQDAQEFLRYLIDGIHEECNAASRRPRRHARHAGAGPKSAQEAWAQYRELVDDSPLVELLVGQLCSTITCTECHNKSHCWDPFWDLSLPLMVRGRGCGGALSTLGSNDSSGSLCSWRSASSSTSSRLSDVIDEFTSKETLDSDERPVCGHCKRPTKSTKQISLARLPQVLILHLKKFTNDGYKLTSPEIQIDNHLTFNGTSRYRLKACISHHGHSSSSGHYTSHCEYSSRWLHFDDGRVRDVTAGFDCGKLDDAYVLFYTQQQQSHRSPVTQRRTSTSSSSSATPTSHSTTTSTTGPISQSKL
jgi:ubiquitin C-terminal hydrolase